MPDHSLSGTADLKNDAVVIVARHGERLDYIMRDRGENWVQQQQQVDGVTVSAASGRPWDTPLTKHGELQAAKLGRQIYREVVDRNLPPLVAVYSSPFLRCRQTALAAIQGFKAAMKQSGGVHPPSEIPPLRVELGLAESFNENWYRSWALPGADGTWGYGKRDYPQIEDPSLSLHPASLLPVQQLLDWKRDMREDNGGEDEEQLDLAYESVTSISSEYRLRPKLLESRQDQRNRMRKVVSKVGQAGKTVVLVSHGGPVTHLYESLTGRDWYDGHGDSSYCCYSIYRRSPKQSSHKDQTELKDSTEEDIESYWNVLVANASQYLNEIVVTERHVSSDNL